MKGTIKYESTVEMVTCMVCGKGGFTAEDPPVHYKGYTDHLSCFRKDFIKNFCKKHDFITKEQLEDVEDVMSLPKLNAAWAALIQVGKPVLTDGEPATVPECIVLHSDYKTKLEDALVEQFTKNSGTQVLGIFRKGKPIEYKTVMTIHIVEEK